MPLVYTCNKGHIRNAAAPPGQPGDWHEACPECGAEGGWVHFPEKYQIAGFLGRGGMGVVFKAVPTAGGDPVAVKILSPSASRNISLTNRFLKEARAVDLLDHRNIVRMTEAGQTEGQPYLVMEFVEGPSLDRVIENNPQPIDFTARTMEALARAMHHAHLRGILHRDLKPSNIILAEHNEPMIVDFGLAKFFNADDGMTISGLILGTVSYMSPEQAKGENKTVGPATDIYGLGGIFYEMLTGRSAFAGSAAHEALLRVVYEVPVPPRNSRSEIPEEIETICLKCLQKDPRDRYESALALAEDLRLFIEGSPIASRRSDLITSGITWARIEQEPPRQPQLAPGPQNTEILDLDGGAAQTGDPGATIIEPAETGIMGEFTSAIDGPVEIHRIKLFNGLSTDQAQGLLRAGHCITYADEDPIFSAGDPADGLYLILSGVVQIYTIVDGQELELNRRGQGAVLGEMGLLLPRSQRTASARAHGDATLFKIPGNPIEIIRMFADPATAITFMRNLLELTQPHDEAAIGKPGDSTDDSAISFAIDPQPILRAMERSLSSAASSLLCQRGELEGGVVFLQPGAVMDGFWVIHEGSLESIGGGESAASILTAPCIVGEVDFFARHDTRGGLRVRDKLKYTWYRRSGFEELLRKEPRAALAVLFSMLQLMVLLTLERDSRRIKAHAARNT